MRFQGRISKWTDDKGFGFITPNGGGEPVFVHISSFSNRRRRPIETDIVTYEVRSDGARRKQAHAVSFADERQSNIRPCRRSFFPPVFAACFLTAAAVAVAIGKLPLIILLIYLGSSALAFAAYAIDKSAAQQNRWRTPESTLHLIALGGGWPGAIMAQRLLRHKSAKISFQAIFWLTVVVNCALLVYLLGPAGKDFLGALSGLL